MEHLKLLELGVSIDDDCKEMLERFLRLLQSEELVTKRVSVALGLTD
jgi:hypothetical protein